MQRSGYWRDASRPVTIWGIPLPFTLIYLLIFPFPSKITLVICTCILGSFVGLNHFGWSLPVIMRRLLHYIHGPFAAGRPWWYRRSRETPRSYTGL